jgi:hypothetical protein
MPVDGRFAAMCRIDHGLRITTNISSDARELLRVYRNRSFMFWIVKEGAKYLGASLQTVYL